MTKQELIDAVHAIEAERIAHGTWMTMEVGNQCFCPVSHLLNSLHGIEADHKIDSNITVARSDRLLMISHLLIERYDNLCINHPSSDGFTLPAEIAKGFFIQAIEDIHND